MGIPTAQAYLYNAPSGVAGDITRVDESSVEPIMLGNDNATAFGIPLKYSSGKAVPFAGSEAATDFQGVLVREVPGINGDGGEALTSGKPLFTQVQGICVRGYISVICVAGTPVRGGIVYVQITANGGVAVGAFRADGVDSGNAVALTATQAEWASSGKDSNNNAELRIAR